MAKSGVDKLLNAEGPGYGCKDDFTITCLLTGETISTRTYLALDHDHSLKPYDWYLSLIVAGISEHKLSDGYASPYRALPYSIDNDPGPRERLIALKAPERAGIADHMTLLTGADSMSPCQPSRS